MSMVIKVGLSEVDKLELRIKELEQRLIEDYDKPLQYLTPLGSEFVNNPKRCMSYIKQRLDERKVLKKENIKLKQKRKDDFKRIDNIVDDWYTRNPKYRTKDKLEAEIKKIKEG